MSNFNINNKFISTTGIIGRRDFLSNYVLINCICMVFLVTPIMYFLLFHPEYLNEIAKGTTPKWFLSGYLIMGLLSSGLLFPSIVRRVRDILGIEDNEKINLISTTITVIFIISYTPIMNNSFGTFISTFILFLLLLMQGKITKDLPKSEIIKFNWGAFLGTWIWGLFNKKPITLLMLPLLLTGGWLHFMVLCGLKGNEWAFEKNQHYFDDIESFHQNQKNQSLLLMILAPTISLILFGIFSYISGNAIIKYAKNNPEFKTKIKTILLNQQASSVEVFYNKIEIKDGNATFYLDPTTWKNATPQMQESIYKNAISYALQKQGKQGLLLKDFITNIELVNKIKILSSFNNEPLAQFYLAPQILEQKVKEQNITEIQSYWNSGYKFNNSPTLP